MRQLIALLLSVLLISSASAEDILSATRKASDMAAGSAFPTSMVSSSYQEQDANGEPYLLRCASGANKLIVFLHTWSTDKNQITTMPEFLGIDRACVVAPNFNGPNNTPAALGSDDSLRRIDIVAQEIMYKTGLSRLYIVAASGGTLAAMNYMGKYPGKVHRASLWLPIYDLSLLYSGTADGSLKTDMISAIGAAPTGPDDPAYLARSPRSRLPNSFGPTEVFINVGLSDTTSPPVHGQQARDVMLSLGGYRMTYKEWSIGHVFDASQRTEAVKQLILE